jgi:hypothetical protein
MTAPAVKIVPVAAPAMTKGRLKTIASLPSPKQPKSMASSVLMNLRHLPLSGTSTVSPKISGGILRRSRSMAVIPVDICATRMEASIDLCILGKTQAVS